MTIPPGWYDSPDTPGQRWWDGSQWGDQRRLPPWRQRHRALSIAISLVGLLVLLGGFFGVFHRSSSTGELNTEALDANIQRWMRQHLGSVDPQVECPTGKPAKQGTEFLCQASDSSGRAAFDVTVINDAGDVKWQMVSTS